MLTFFIVICFFLAGVFGVLWLMSARTPNNNRSERNQPDILTKEQIKKELILPSEWDERLLEQTIRDIAASNNPALLEHFVKSVKVRLIMAQDARTAQKSTQFLRSLIERLGILKQLRIAYDDLGLYEKELDLKWQGIALTSTAGPGSSGATKPRASGHLV